MGLRVWGLGLRAEALILWGLNAEEGLGSLKLVEGVQVPQGRATATNAVEQKSDRVVVRLVVTVLALQA